MYQWQGVKCGRNSEKVRDTKTAAEGTVKALAINTVYKGPKASLKAGEMNLGR